MRRNGMTLMELLTVISILATLSAFLFPVYTQVRKRIYVTQCATQMKQIGVALKMYLHDWGSDSPYDVPPIFLNCSLTTLTMRGCWFALTLPLWHLRLSLTFTPITERYLVFLGLRINLCFP